MRTRHQLAPAMPRQKIVDRAVGADWLFVSRLEILDVQHVSSPGGLGKARQQHLLLHQRHVLALPPANRLKRFDLSRIIRHVGAVYCAQRNAHRVRDRGLRHTALASNTIVMRPLAVSTAAWLLLSEFVCWCI
jgi:hypothetical protein